MRAQHVANIRTALTIATSVWMLIGIVFALIIVVTAQLGNSMGGNDIYDLLVLGGYSLCGVVIAGGWWRLLCPTKIHYGAASLWALTAILWLIVLIPLMLWMFLMCLTTGL